MFNEKPSTMKSGGCIVLLFFASGLFPLAKPQSLSEEFRSEFAKSSCEFTLDILKSASTGAEENLIFSPSSIGVLLAILQQGARDNTSVQLEKVLRLSAEDSKTAYGHVIRSLRREKTNLTLEWGNKAFFAPGFEPKEDFLKSVQDNFNASFEELDFKASSPESVARRINEWVKEVTHDNIEDLVDATLLTPDMVMLMVNAIYFKSVWDSPFQKYKTRQDKFQTNAETKVEVPFMRQAGRFSAGEDAEVGIKWVELPFQDENFSMIFVLPIKANGLNQVIENLSGTTLKHIINNRNTRRVKLTIPKFKLSEKISLGQTLQELGLTDLFTNESNLKGISEGEDPLQLSQLIHQANVEIDEDGTTAAAATFEIVQTLSLEWFTDELYFKADHPFLFLILDKVNQVPVFAGKVANPKSSFPK